MGQRQYPNRAFTGLQVLVSLLATTCFAQDDDDFEIDRCARWHHQSMLRGQSIFLDGGVQLNRNNGSTWLGFSKYIFEVDMSVPWNVSTNYTEKRIGRFGSTLMGANPPNMVRGSLYRGPGNDSRVFTFGGTTFIANTSDPDWQAPSSNEYSLWTFDTTLQTWAQYNVMKAVPQRPNWGLIAEDIINGVGFYLNGQVDHGSSNVLYSTTEYVAGQLSNATGSQIEYLDGMVIIDMSTQQARNVSTESLGPARVAGGMVHSPYFGKTPAGALVTFGGMTSSNNGTDTFTNGNIIDFSTVSLCDSFNEDNPIWVHQNTTGDIPPPRIDYCTLPQVIHSKDNSSFQFHIHGGYNPRTNTTYSDVYALSLPSFTWTLLSNNTPNTPGRFGHTCHKAGARQFVRFGGSLNPSMFGVETTALIPNNLSSLTCDANTAGVALFDISDCTWGDGFERYAPAYQVPQKIVDKIGGSPDGGATMTSPKAGFDNQAIYTMFHPPPPTSTPAPSSSHNSSSNAGAIAGGVVGGLAALSMIALILFLHRRRANRKRAAQQAAATRQQRDLEEAKDKKFNGGLDGSGAAAVELGQDEVHELGVPAEKKEVLEMPGDDGAKEASGMGGVVRGEKQEQRFFEMLGDVPERRDGGQG